MTSKKPPKKSDMLEVRVPHATKRAFQRVCQEEGRTASEVVREFVDAYITRAAHRRSSTNRSIAMIMETPAARRGALAGGVAALALVVFAVTPSTAQSDIRTVFDRLDADGDGLLTFDEYGGDERRTIIQRTLERLAESGDDAPAIDMQHVREHLERARDSAPDGYEEDGALDFGGFEASFSGMFAGLVFSLSRDGEGVTFDQISASSARMQSPMVQPIADLFTEARFYAYDHDADGAVTPEEMMAGPTGG